MSVELINLAGFQNTLREFVEKVDIAPGLVATRVAFDLFGRVAAATPVDTGWARASWNISENKANLRTPPEGTATPLAQPGPQPQTEFPKWHITNNVPYILMLEAGRTKQTDKGYMVARSMSVVQKDLENAVRAVKREQGL